MKMRLKIKNRKRFVISITIMMIIIVLVGSVILNKNTVQASGEEKLVRHKVPITDEVESIDNIISENNEETEETSEETIDEVVKKEEEITETNPEPEIQKTEKSSVPATSNGVPYYVIVNYTSNVVTIYGKDTNNQYTVPVKAMVCSTGVATPKSGVYKLTNTRYRWRALFGGVYGQYAVPIVGNILFHSVPYQKTDISALEYWEYDKLGTSASAGCIRLTVEDALWIYNNCGSGTNVEFSSNSDNPLGKPIAQKISENVNLRGYDPTDPDTSNPWRNANNFKVEEKTVSSIMPVATPVANTAVETILDTSDNTIIFEEIKENEEKSSNDNEKLENAEDTINKDDNQDMNYDISE